VQTHHSDAQYTDRKRLDLAVPKRFFHSIENGLHVVSYVAYSEKQQPDEIQAREDT
jgi:hypothetical protein